MTKREQQVLDACDGAYLEQVLADLVAFDSVANNETSAQEYMGAELARLGLDTDVWEIDFEELRGHPSYSSDVERSHGLGVTGTLRGTGPTLILNGHVDVVEAGELDRWTSPPFQLTRREGHFYGRGVLDMKGQLCAGLTAVRALREAAPDSRCSVQVQSVIGEEDGGAGTLATILRGHTADAAIVLEPTDLSIAPAQAGALSFQLTVPGRAAHGAFREEGVDPVEKFIPLFRALRALETRRNQSVEDRLFREEELPFALTMGRLQAGVWPSTVAETLLVEGRYGVAPGEDLGSARAQLEATIQDAASEDQWLRDHPPTVTWEGAQFAAARTDEDEPIVATLQSTAAAVSGEPRPVKGVRYGADMRHLVLEGGIPTVLFGPGDVRLAHRPDENIVATDLLKAARILALTALRFGPR